jgi:hypothetical protein
MASYGHRFALRPLAALLFVLALLAAPASALASNDDAARAQERYYQSYTAAPAVPDTDAALAQEQYLQSYGAPTPIPHPASSGGSSDTWLIVGLSVAAIVLVAGSATQLRRRRTAGSPA